MTNCLSGSTIRIQVTFKDFNDNLIDPSSTKLVIYDKTGKEISDYSPLVKDSLGIYHFDYTTPITIKKDTQYYCEASGIIDDNTVLCRDTFTTQFIATS